MRLEVKRGVDFSGFEQLFPSEEACLQLWLALRWRNGIYCPYCEFAEISGPSVADQYKCRKCRRTFSYKVGSIVQGSPLPIQRWFRAIWLVTECNLGVTSTELSTLLGIRQTSAWRMLRVPFPRTAPRRDGSGTTRCCAHIGETRSG
jgi:transposase-like protein